jgi:hypothetical protein
MYSEAMFVQTNSYLDNLKRDYQFGGIAFLYMWDIIRDTFNEVTTGNSGYDEYMPAINVGIEDVWDAYEKDPWGGFDVDQSNVLEWLMDCGLVVEFEDLEEGV